MNYTKYLHLFCTTLLLLLPLIGCAPAVKQVKPTMSESMELDLKEIPEEFTPAHENYLIVDPSEVVFVADSLIKNGEILASAGHYDIAHNLATIALELLESTEEDEVLDSLVQEYQIFTKYSRFYVELMPPSYLDSLSPEVSSFITRYQLYQIAASMDTTDLDTSLIPESCDNGAHYNIPITHNKRVQKALVTLLAPKRKRYMERLLRIAHFYRPMMNLQFEESGLPTDLTFLPLLESAFNPKAYSHAHASGLWQFIPSTGKVFGLRNSYWVDERRDPMKSTAAAIAYFTRLHGMFDDWYLSLASYNCGEGRVSRALKKAEATSYWNLKLPSETMNYVPLYIAYQIISKNPHCFGYTVDTTLRGVWDYDTVHVSDCIDMKKIAQGVGVHVDTLYKINPHIIKWCTPPDLKNVTLYLPEGKAEVYKKFYKTLSKADKVKWYRYKVQRGDNLGYIAEKFEVSVSAIKSINRMKSNRIVAGRYIFIPISSGSSDLIYESLHPNDKKRVSTGAPQENFKYKKKVSYTVKEGESLYLISRGYKVSVEDICRWNSIENPAQVRVGQKLVLYRNKTRKEIAKEQKKRVLPKGKGKRRYYEVQNGENFYTIAQKLEVSLSDLIAWNGKDEERPIIHPRDKLVYYGEVVPSKRAIIKKKAPKTRTIKYRVKKGDTMYGIALLFGTTVKDIQALNRLKTTSLQPGDILLVSQKAKRRSSLVKRKKNVIYKVRKGDTLWSISRNFDVSVQAICTTNKIKKESGIHPGDTLKIPLSSKE